MPYLCYFINVSIDYYKEYYKDYFDCLGMIDSDKLWSFKKEAIKYCELDCITLYQILIKFNNLIFETFNININKYPTLSSLAFAIFRSKYLNESKIAMLSGDIFNFIKESYTGGAVDMYLPNGENLYAYDVNSLYPYIMANSPMPVDTPIYFEGNILDQDPNAFGFFRVKVINNSNLIHPIIQTHIKTKGGIRTIAPLGTWEMVIFSEELKNAIKYGYKF